MSRWRKAPPGADETDAGDTMPASGERRATVARPSRWTADPTGNTELWHALDDGNQTTACGVPVPPSWARVSSLPPTVFDRQDLLCWQCGQIRRRRITEPAF